MKKLVPFFLFLIVLSSCNNENPEVDPVNPTPEVVKNDPIVDIDKKHGKTYNWMEGFEILNEYSVDPKSWMPSLYFKLKDGKFVKTERPKHD